MTRNCDIVIVSAGTKVRNLLYYYAFTTTMYIHIHMNCMCVVWLYYVCNVPFAQHAHAFNEWTGCICMYIGLHCKNQWSWRTNIEFCKFVYICFIYDSNYFYKDNNGPRQIFPGRWLTTSQPRGNHDYLWWTASTQRFQSLACATWLSNGLSYQPHCATVDDAFISEIPTNNWPTICGQGL